MKAIIPIILLLLLLYGSVACNTTKRTESDNTQTGLQPWTVNPKYWQYQGAPVLLLGATDNDNLFQSAGLREHLEQLKSAGGNYVRNTMSSRDSGDLWPYWRNQEGRYDLDRWNVKYWNKLEDLLRWTSELEIMVQIEVWDRFDYSREPWQNNPINSRNNVNYTSELSGLAAEYPRHPAADLQPFFHTIPGMPLYGDGSDLIRAYQEMYVEKLLEHTLKYDHVLYCMNNETSTPVDWGNYWIRFIRDKAAEAGVEVYLTDMYDHFHKPASCERCRDLIASPDLYTFMDVSQINSRNFDQAHWDTLRWIINKRDQYPLRPVNCTKVYGGNESNWGSGTNDDGVERFLRDIFGGCAAVRHHRPVSGNGLNEKARASIRSVRKAESVVKLWDMQPAMDLLDQREPDEAYLVRGPNNTYLLYFPGEGSVSLQVGATLAGRTIRWIDVSEGVWISEQEIGDEAPLWIETPGDRGYIAVVGPGR